MGLEAGKEGSEGGDQLTICDLRGLCTVDL